MTERVEGRRVAYDSGGAIHFMDDGYQDPYPSREISMLRARLRELEETKSEPRRRRTKTKRKTTMAKKARKKAHCKRVRVRKGSSKKRLMCWGANGKIVSAKRSKAGKKAARKRRR